ncbi:SH2 domain-containing protein 1B-like [Candoia aspera]|uniref:SH2 domain-containing protein 1B-like n=1 Tax=Candoia aspera TaxID=51853 RepID=UPI002FD81B1A
MEFQYFHGNISKEKCEELLSKMGVNGSFLVRNSESIPGALCLCVFYEHLIYTYRIFRKSNGHFMMQTSEGTPTHVFRTLKDLIDNYKKPNQGLVVNLCYPLYRSPCHQTTQTVYVTKDEAYVTPDAGDSDYLDVLPD